MTTKPKEDPLIVSRLAGHTLPNEGRIYENSYRVTDGPAVCSCGWKSQIFGSDSARRDAHRRHKAEKAAVGR